MSATAPTTPERLVDRIPSLTGAQMLAELVPPRQFTGATLESYRPDRDYPSQGAAVAAMRHFLTSAQKAKLFSRKKAPVAKPGVYLDGGFGVGKTHLLAALWHQTAGRKYFGTFIEYTALVGAVGYAPAVQLLKGATLVCIDEFELDDPGDTRLISRLLSELVASGTKIAATSNTPPNALGEGRFAAQDFLREIDSLSAKFETIRIDGLDYRRRDTGAHAIAVDDAAAAISAVQGVVTLDSFDGVLKHLAGVHPSRYVKLIEGVDAIALTGVHEFTNQTDALRFVAFVDRLYDAQIPVYAEGTPLDAVFPDDMLDGGYSKKYLRAVSRLIALTSNNA
ncbi:cell division protein ZapE [Salinibacterium sp. NSLL150]|uniref:cell division protein ZapE n=1 Tax=unclassified Salinibacterium TaxID=2632331 RepID=UPI0018CCD1F1|nr:MULTISPECIES: cell division protein ZapE [unclassified Salinibacterium]MBH0099029.1 cell division protein ZapE [Salinibacterium sp. NSLL35]MBH0101783.1 cell division protein ZapE [Salinibacterium sp. NSLL150]MBH0104543.1 cell division protein ZapE [Salinibacterium sp. NSLL16]MBH0107303.1 cell division protein ZapE [Salinibacterium sp. NSLL17]MBH0108920.1 cell division protein ZapE [Salinibacterium sp. NG22]